MSTRHVWETFDVVTKQYLTSGDNYLRKYTGTRMNSKPGAVIYYGIYSTVQNASVGNTTGITLSNRVKAGSIVLTDSLDTAEVLTISTGRAIVFDTRALGSTESGVYGAYYNDYGVDGRISLYVDSYGDNMVSTSLVDSFSYHLSTEKGSNKCGKVSSSSSSAYPSDGIQ